jgi:hypothetical protein
MSNKCEKTEKSKIKRKKNRLLLSAILLICFLILSVVSIITAGFFPVHHHLITKKVIAFIRQAGADSCSIGQLQVTAWKQIEVSNLYMCNTSNNKPYAIKIEHCRMNYDIHTLLKELLIIKKGFNIKKIDPAIFFADQFHALQQIYSFSKNTAGITKLEASGCKLQYKQKDSAYVVFDKVACDISLKNDSMFEGAISVDSFSSAHQKINLIKGQIAFNNKIVTFKECSGQIRNGRLIVNGSVDLNDHRVKNMVWVADSVNIDQYYSSQKKYFGKITGTARVVFHFNDSPIHSDSLSGNGSIYASNVNLVNIPVQKAIVSLLNLPSISTVKFDSVRSDFRIMAGNKITAAVKANGPVVQLLTDGWIELKSDSLNQNIEGRFTRSFVQTLPSVVTGAMVETANHERMFKCRIYGTLDHPKISLSKETLNKAINNVFEDMKQSLQGYFTGK